SGSCRRNDLDSKPVSPKRAEDVALQSKVIGDDVMGYRREFLEEIAGCVDGGFGRELTFCEHPASTFSILAIPVVGGGGGHLLDKVHSLVGNGACELDGFLVAYALDSDACPH